MAFSTSSSVTHYAASRDDDDDLDARCARIRQRLLDGIEETLDALAQRGVQRAAIARAVQAHVAPLFCRQALCRRAKICRRNPCTMPRAAAAPKKATWARSTVAVV